MSDADVAKHEGKRDKKDWLPVPQTADDAKLLEKAGFLNLVAPFGIGVFYLGKKTNNSELKKRAICQMASSLLLVGIAWSISDGIRLWNEGKGRTGNNGKDKIESEAMPMEKKKEKKCEKEEKKLKKEAAAAAKLLMKDEQKGKKESQKQKSKKKEETEEAQSTTEDRKMEEEPRIQDR